jgi:hypothetical protein
MFIFLILLTVITYPFVFAGSCFVGVFIIMVTDGSPSAPNPFVSPARVFRLYKETFAIWSVEIAAWYQENKD